jgi:hypothetical protein
MNAIQHYPRSELNVWFVGRCTGDGVSNLSTKEILAQTLHADIITLHIHKPAFNDKIRKQTQAAFHICKPYLETVDGG